LEIDFYFCQKRQKSRNQKTKKKRKEIDMKERGKRIT